MSILSRVCACLKPVQTSSQNQEHGADHQLQPGTLISLFHRVATGALKSFVPFSISLSFSHLPCSRLSRLLRRAFRISSPPHAPVTHPHESMRLLHYDEHGELGIISFDESAIPPYAILSHTWGADMEEVTFADLVTGAGKAKRGYEKILVCGQQAQQDGLQYFWVDTCCINKSTNDELSTAINSMFRWYQRAHKCYVYLSDVYVPDEVRDTGVFRISWQEAFRRSRWFTRGWTLQELLAPASVEFFSVQGKRLGSRISLEQEIHGITKVPIGALRGQQHLSEFTVLERMSWAADRQTTHKEDKAYCLLGIFGVFLPLIYGEGEEHAFQRLRDEIQRHSGMFQQR
jgi:hypothetical protein